MNFIDLFSGIGGFRSGLEKNGHNCLAYSEIDKFAKQSYQAIYSTENEVDLNDITKVSDEYFRSFRGKCDIIVGGFPCQAFSIAGKRRGFEDTRGTLFFHIARAIKEIEPSFVLLENVKGLFSHDKGRTFGTIIQALDELGYVVEWQLFNSKYWGVPQNRERVYILVTRKDVFKRPILFDLGQKQKSVNARLIDVLENDVDESYFLSDEKIAKLTLNDDLSGKLNYYNYRELDTVHSTKKVAPTLNTMQGGERQPKIAVPVLTSAMGQGRGRVPMPVYSKLHIRKLTPLECWRLQGFTDEQFYKAKNIGISNSQLYKQAGNAVTVNVVDAIISKIDEYKEGEWNGED